MQLRRLDDIYRLIPEVARLADRHPTELSGGQQKLVALGRSMMAGQRMLVLDEPFEGVALSSSENRRDSLSA